MSGLQTDYTAANSDCYFQYAANEWAWARMWLPTGYRTQTEIPVKVTVPGGGWDNAHDLTFDNIHDPYRVYFTNTSVDSDLIDRGWAIVHIEWPTGMNINLFNRAHPVSRWPAIPRAIGRIIQFIKTHATDGFILGPRTGTFSTSHTRYILDGVSSGGIEALWVGLQPDKALKYEDRFIQSGGLDSFVYRYNHRVRGIIDTDGICDFTKFEADTISADALPRFKPRENCFATPAFTEIPARQKRDASVLELARANYDENKHLGIFHNMKDGSIADGQSLPASGCQGSYLGSGTAVTYSTGGVTGTPIVGETVSGTTGTGTIVFHSAAFLTLYIERSSTATFTGTITGGTSGFTLSSYSVSGNNNRLAFLTWDTILGIVDAAGVEGEITDFTHVHEMTSGAQLKRALDANDIKNKTNLHRHYIGNDYVASLGSKPTTPSFQWSGLDYNTEVLDWIEGTLGITV